MRLLVLLTMVAGNALYAAGEPNVQPDPARFAQDIADFERWDSKNSYPADAVLFVGSSSIRMWPTKMSFPDMPVINRGFGGSHISDVNFYFRRIVLPYKPKVIVFYAGDNDVISGKSAQQVFEDFRCFVQMVRQELPKTRIIFIGIKPSNSRWHVWPVMQQANEMVRGLCEQDGHMVFVDAGSVLLNEDGKPNNAYFLEDKLHLNTQGYQKWTQVLRPVVEREYNRKGD
jgi:lysophospholipase L1-like esterase